MWTGCAYVKITSHVQHLWEICLVCTVHSRDRSISIELSWPHQQANLAVPSWPVPPCHNADPRAADWPAGWLIARLSNWSSTIFIAQKLEAYVGLNNSLTPRAGHQTSAIFNEYCAELRIFCDGFYFIFGRFMPRGAPNRLSIAAAQGTV